MPTRVAGLEMNPVIIVAPICDGWMLVSSRAVMVLRVFVVRIRVGVQRRHLDGSADDREADQNGDEALHEASLWKPAPVVKLTIVAACGCCCKRARTLRRLFGMPSATRCRYNSGRGAPAFVALAVAFHGLRLLNPVRSQSK